MMQINSHEYHRICYVHRMASLESAHTVKLIRLGCALLSSRHSSCGGWGNVFERVTKESLAATQRPACTTMLTVQTDRCIYYPDSVTARVRARVTGDKQPEMDIKGSESIRKQIKYKSAHSILPISTVHPFRENTLVENLLRWTKERLNITEITMKISG